MAALRWSPSEPLKVWVGLTGLAAAAAVLGVSIRQRRALLVSLQEKAARLEFERDQEGRLGAAAERARIAREMHDIVAHNLTVMIALADGASYAMDTSPERALQATERVSATGRQALLEMRRLLGVLREEPSGASAGAAAQPRPARRAPGAGRCRRDPGHDGSRRRSARARRRRPAGRLPGRPGGADEHAQARRSSHPRTSRAELPSGPGRAGGDQHGRTGEPSAASGGRGLRGMRERAASYGGKLDVGPRPQGGWRVHLRLNPDAEGALP